MTRTKWFGPLLVGVQWEWDCRWDWKSDVGDKHSDFVAVSRCQRGASPSLWRILLGPLALSFAVQPKEAKHG